MEIEKHVTWAIALFVSTIVICSFGYYAHKNYLITSNGYTIEMLPGYSAPVMVKPSE